MPTLGASLDFVKFEARNMRGHQLAAAPSSPVTGQLYYNTGDNTLYWYDGSQWVSARGGAAATPPATTGSLGTIQLAGDLAGTATSPQIAAGVITDADVNAANKDGAVGTASMRTLGAGAAQAMPGNRTLDAITAPAADLSLNNKKIIGLADPISATDGANKQYVDNLASGLDAKASVRAASAGALTLSGTQTVDGVALIAGDRILVKDQAPTTNNGIYVVAAGAWARAADMDTWNEHVAAYVWVEDGTLQKDTGWLCTVDQGGTLGTTGITWVQFSGAGSINPGAGLTKSGSTIDVGQGAGITVNADSVQVANNGITNAMLADGAVDLATADVTGILPLTKGGTAADATTASGKQTARANLWAAGIYVTTTHGAGTTISIPAATHSLGSGMSKIVQCQVIATGDVVIPDVNVNGSGDVTITFGVSQSANTIRVTIIG